MKLIFSRKGFESEYGKDPSPILPDGRFVSLPIPGTNERHTYHHLQFEQGKAYSDLLHQLGYHDQANCECHLDPDIYREVLNRPAGFLYSTDFKAGFPHL